MKFSIIIPVHNEAESLVSLHHEILASMKDSFEVIYINDASEDNSKEIIDKLENSVLINFEKRLGQTLALNAGFERASGDYIVTLDGDGQNDPRDIDKIYEHLLTTGADCVSGWRKNRKDSVFKKGLAHLAFIARKIIANDDTKDSGCTLKIYKRDCVKNLPLYSGMHRFMPIVLRKRGFTVVELEVSHRPRLYGKSKYGLARIVAGLIDLVKISQKND